MKYRFFDIFLGLFVAVLLISNVASTKIVSFGAITFDGGTILFPLVYILGDVFTEVYGYRAARRVIWVGFTCALLMSLVFIVVGMMPAATDWAHQDAYDAILGLTPRIVLASLAAYLVGEFANSGIMAKMKVATKGRFLWTRTIGSTIVGQGLDTVFFVLVAFAGILPGSVLWSIIITNYIFKVGIEVVLTPVTYRGIKYVKEREQIDVYDTHTKLNPFSITKDKVIRNL